jgi:type II secretory pathway pseudopilin PulG
MNAPKSTRTTPRTSRRRVRFSEEDNDTENQVQVQVHDLPEMYDSERGHYWYSRSELQEMLKTAIVETNQAFQEAKKKKNRSTGSSANEQHTLRGLESLSPTVQARKQQIELERVRVIQAYQKQRKQTGQVDHLAIQSLYKSYTTLDIKRAIAYGVLDAQESYCYDASKNKTNKKNPTPTTSSSRKGMLGRMFSSNHKKVQQSQKQSTK